METRSLEYLALACQGELLQGERGFLIQGICTDSRRIQAGDLFVALEGERFDGHQYLEEARAKGARAVVVQQAKVPPAFLDCGVIAVDNTRKALGRMAARYRADFAAPAIAIAGSNGKTTTKELIASVLGQRLSILRSEASFNNDIGVPLTLLKLERAHQAAVLEVGTNHPGELAPLLSMIQPHFGVLTSLGREHLEHFGDLAGVAREEGWVGELLPPQGKLFLNGDCAGMEAVLNRTAALAARIGMGGHNDWRARLIVMDDNGAVFHLQAPDARWTGEYAVPLPGRHQVLNAAFAVALGAEFGLRAAEIQRGLSACPQPKMRLQIRRAKGLRILDDAYNANADSMLAALQTLKDLACDGRRVAVLGDMAELGAQTEPAHAEIGRRAGELRIDRLFTVGQWAQVTAQAAQKDSAGSAQAFDSLESLTAALQSFLKPGDLVLFKASRTARLERVMDSLEREDPPATTADPSPDDLGAMWPAFGQPADVLLS